MPGASSVSPHDPTHVYATISAVLVPTALHLHFLSWACLGVSLDKGEKGPSKNGYGSIIE